MNNDAIALQRLYKDALSRLTTGVTVVATHHAGQDFGMTCNSFTSVSLDPALVLWCLRKDSHSHAAYTASGEDGGYTVSILGADQQALATQFATGDQAERFAGVDLERLTSGRPRVADAIAWFDCRLVSCTPAGDHDVLIGRVLDFGITPGEGLVYSQRVFGRLSAPAAA
jgi:flavin reductase (DIM6/NTAB) family NADH-FMN oxidoreductase RutF